MPELPGSYHPLLVLISLLVAVLSAYTAISLAGRRHAAGTVAAARGWLVAGGCALGAGIWSMHFIGMLAFRLPIALGYDLTLTLISLAIAICLSIFALWVAGKPRLGRRALVAGAGLMGTGIAAMHYVGMAAMRMAPGIIYDPLLVALSVTIAVAASAAALWLFHRLKRARGHAPLLRPMAALAMGLAIVGMHYTGMAAASFPADSLCLAASEGLSTGWLAVAVIVGSLCVLAVALVISLLDARAQERASQLADSLAHANRELLQLALHDNLTRLPNRILLQERMTQAIADARGGGPSFAVLFIDLDGFKAINDLHGHEAGDELLRTLARRTSDTLEEGESLARLGGDEFVALVRAASPGAAADRAQSLIDAFARPVRIGTLEMLVTASIGIALHPAHGRDARTLLRHADAAMYHAKRAGRSGFSVFEPAMNAGAQERVLLLNELRVAVAQGQFELHFQPKFLVDGTLTGAEALLRWRHARHGVMGPDSFVDLLESSGLILPVGRWVLQQACLQLREWHDRGRPELTMAVNLSAVQFAHESLFDDVRTALEQAGLQPAALTLEITESTAMREVQASLDTLRRLTDMGVGISIDDFGTGYSSLLYLKRLPANELKIDRAFVGQLEHTEADSTIVSAIIALARKLRLKVVAEGVETEAQQRFLTELGCDSLQGFLLGRPMEPDTFWTVAQQTRAAGFAAMTGGAPRPA